MAEVKLYQTFKREFSFMCYQYITETLDIDEITLDNEALDYQLKYECNIKLSEDESLDDKADTIYTMFSIKHPEGYNTRSVSMSDVIEIDGVLLFVDTFGFRKIKRLSSK